MALQKCSGISRGYFEDVFFTLCSGKQNSDTFKGMLISTFLSQQPFNPANPSASHQIQTLTTLQTRHTKKPGPLDNHYDLK